MRTAATILLVAFLCVSWPVGTAADEPKGEGGVSFYVSDKFISVAKKISKQFAASQIEKACPKENPLCSILAKELIPLFTAAISKDTRDLKVHLDSFFESFAVSSAIYLIFEELISSNQSSDIALLVNKFVPCLSSAITGKLSETSCTLKKKDYKQIWKVFEEKKSNILRGCNFGSYREEKRIVIKPDDFLCVIENIVSGEPIDRPDLRVYVRRIRALFKEGLEDNLFDAVYSFLLFQPKSQYEEELINYFHAKGQYNLWSSSEDDGFLKVLERCGQDVTKFANWQTERDKNKYLEKLRKGLILGEDVSDTPLTDLLSLDCPKGTPLDKIALKTLKRSVRYNVAPLKIRRVVEKYGLAVLSAAALIDFIRTSNSDRLDKDIRRTLVYGLAQTLLPVFRSKQLGTYENKITSLSCVDLQDIYKSCEVTRILLLLGKPVVLSPGGELQCYSILNGAMSTINLKKYNVRNIGDAQGDTRRLAVQFAHFIETVSTDKEIELDKLIFAIESNQDIGFKIEWDKIRNAISALNANPLSMEERIWLQDYAVQMLDGARLDNIKITDEESAGIYERIDEFFIGKLGTTKSTQNLFILEDKPSNSGKVFYREAMVILHDVLDRMLDMSRNEEWRSLRPYKKLLSAAKCAMDGDHKGARNIIYRMGVELIDDKVDELIGRVIKIDREECLDDYRSRSIFSGLDAECAASFLITSAYKPISEYFWEGRFAEADTEKMAMTVYNELRSTPYIDNSVFIFNVGLGANYLFANEDVWGEDGTVAMTLLDKFGLAFYKGNYSGWIFELGPFVGGFLDALIKTAADEGEDKRFWLAGFTIGLPRIAGVDVGFEIHVAATMPFTFKKGDFGLSAGGAIVIPFSAVFNEEE